MSFDSLAQHYRWMEKVLAGEKLQRCRTAFLDEVTNARRILICGEGSGRFLEAFLKVNRHGSITCLDASGPMLHVSAKAISQVDRARVEFVQADILQWHPQGADFDLIVTNFFLDCFREEQMDQIIATLSKGASLEAHWLLADFHQPQHQPARLRARCILWLMYRFFRLTTKLPASELVSPDRFLKRHGFRLVKQQLSDWGLLRADLWQRRMD